MFVAYAISTAFLVLSVSLICLTQFRHSNALIYYGKVAQGQSHADSSFCARVINAVAKITVPKAWFAHFYVLYSVLMWGQLVVAPHLIWQRGKYSLVWIFLTCQASRRLYESYKVTRWSNASKMHISHYLLGFIFYVGISATCFLGLQNSKSSKKNDDGSLVQLWLGVTTLTFIYFQVDQFRNHQHLASLVKYSTPYKGLFSKVSSAHYLDEIVIYFLVVVVAFSKGEIIAEDWSLLSMWIFVVTILSIYFNTSITRSIIHIVLSIFGLVSFTAACIAPEIKDADSQTVFVANFRSVVQGNVVFYTLNGYVTVGYCFDSKASAQNPYTYRIHDKVPFSGCDPRSRTFDPYCGDFGAHSAAEKPVGDLSGKHGLITQGFIYGDKEDRYLSINSKDKTFVDKMTIVIEDSKGKIIACEGIRLVTTPKIPDVNPKVAKQFLKMDVPQHVKALFA